MAYYTGNYSTDVKTKQENKVNQMKAYHKQREEITHIEKYSSFLIDLGLLLIYSGPSLQLYIRQLGPSSQIQTEDHR